MERLAPGGTGSSLDSGYLANLTATVNHITSKGAYTVLDPHNFGRYKDAIITDTAAFKTFWTNLGGAFKANSKVVCSFLTAHKIFIDNSRYLIRITSIMIWMLL